jgi:hypothetical protein
MGYSNYRNQLPGLGDPTFVILVGQYHLSAWYEDDDIRSDWALLVSDNGWTTNKVGFEWLMHFDKHTKSRTSGRYRLLILDGHESHDSFEFKQFCLENNIA